jgi:hypothetical protein
MNYSEYKEHIKKLELTSIKFMKMLNMNEKTPATNWRRQNKVPKVVEILIEVLFKLPEETRVLYIFNKLKDAENNAV